MIRWRDAEIKIMPGKRAHIRAPPRAERECSWLGYFRSILLYVALCCNNLYNVFYTEKTRPSTPRAHPFADDAAFPQPRADSQKPVIRLRWFRISVTFWLWVSIRKSGGVVANLK